MHCASACNRVARLDLLAAGAVDPPASHSGCTTATFVVVHRISFASTRWFTCSPPVLPLGLPRKGGAAAHECSSPFATSLTHAMRYLTMERSLDTPVTGVSRAAERVFEPSPNTKKTLTFP
jgi:hypothetical protein